MKRRRKKLLSALLQSLSWRRANISVKIYQTLLSGEQHMNKSAGGEKAGLGDLMKKAQEMQKKMQEIQKQISEMEISGQSGGGLVKITMTGQHYAKRVALDPSLMQEEKAILEDLIAAAINDAADKIEKGTRDKMSALTGIKLPDGFEFPEN